MAIRVNRKILSIVLGVCLLVLLIALIALNAFNREVSFLTPSTTEQTFVFTGLSAVAFLLFVAVLVLLVRNLLKLYAEQRSRVLGSHLRTRMLTGAVLVSLVPIAFMFAFSYGLMNRAVDRWFSQPVNEMRDDSNRMALELARYTTANARAEAESIATSLLELTPSHAENEPTADTGHSAAHVATAARHDRETVERVLRQHEITLQNGFVIVYRNGQAVASFQMPQRDGATAQVKPWLPEKTVDEDGNSTSEAAADGRAFSDPTDAAILAAAQRNDEPVFSLNQTDFALGTATMKQGGTVVVGLPMPYGMSTTMTHLRTAADNYWTLFRERRQVRSLYTILLLMMTGLALFAATWLALHLSKQVTKPVEALADAMDAIASGDYGHRVKESATEELGELVRSFNHMAADLEGSRRAVDESTVQLSAANATLEARRSELETMLETIPNGVATLDADRRIVLTNRALSEMMDPGGQRSFVGRSMDDVFPAEVVEVIDRLIKRSHRMGSASSELEVSGGANDRFGGTMNLLATVALLEMPGGNAAGASGVCVGARECDGAAAGAEAVGVERSCSAGCA